MVSHLCVRLRRASRFEVPWLAVIRLGEGEGDA